MARIVAGVMLSAISTARFIASTLAATSVALLPNFATPSSASAKALARAVMFSIWDDDADLG